MLRAARATGRPFSLLVARDGFGDRSACDRTLHWALYGTPTASSSGDRFGADGFLTFAPDNSVGPRVEKVKIAWEFRGNALDSITWNALGRLE